MQKQTKRLVLLHVPVPAPEGKGKGTPGSQLAGSDFRTQTPKRSEEEEQETWLAWPTSLLASVLSLTHAPLSQSPHRSKPFKADTAFSSELCFSVHGSGTEEPMSASSLGICSQGQALQREHRVLDTSWDHSLREGGLVSQGRRSHEGALGMEWSKFERK